MVRLSPTQDTVEAASRLLYARGGRVLDLVAAVSILLPVLGGVAELAPQTLCPVLQPLADECFWRGLDLLLQPLLFDLLFLYFFDAFSPPGQEKGPRRRPLSGFIRILKSGCS